MHDGVLFAEPPHLGLLRRMRLIQRKDRPEMLRRIAIAVAIGWVPLAVACALLAAWHGSAILIGFAGDIATHVRMLLALPLFIAAEYMILPRLEVIGLYFRTSSLLAPEDRERFHEIAAETRRMSAGVWPSATLFVLSYATVLVMMAFVRSETLASWQRLPDSNALSFAGAWHMFVSLPLLLGMIYAWLWRIGLWMRFLLKVSHFDLRLVASHPDRVAGLQFLARSPVVFVPLALAVGLIVAGTMANQVVHQGLQPLEHASTPVVTALVMVALLCCTPLTFARALLATKRAAVFRYGELATRLGLEFERKWLRSHEAVTPSALGEPDFSATTDLYSVASNVYAMHLLPFDYRSAIPLAIAVLAPFVPIWLSEVPLKTVIHALVGIHL